MVKNIAFYIGFMILSLNSYSQEKEPAKETVNDFVISYIYKCKYEKNDALRTIAYVAGRRIGYTQIDIEIAMEKMDSDKEFREALYKVFVELQRGDEEFLSLNLLSIGMQPNNAKKLAHYIYNKYGRPVTEQNEIVDTIRKQKTITSTNKPKAIFSSKISQEERIMVVNNFDYNKLKNVFTVDSLKVLCGSDNITEQDVYDTEGAVIGKEYVIFNGTKNEAIIQFRKAPKNNTIIFKSKMSDWKLPEGLYIGMPLKSLVDINGKDFEIYGFEWDYSGCLVSWNNGKLQKKGISVVLAAPEDVDDVFYSKFCGEKKYRSNNTGLSKLGLYLHEVSFRNSFK